MTPLGEWLKPPRALLLILFLLTLVSVSALCWFGWNLTAQERLVEAQRREERLEQTADRIAATLRGALAETGEHLGASLAAPPEGGLLLHLNENDMAAMPAGRLLYDPSPASEPEPLSKVFAEAEAFEFQEGQPAKAAELYSRFANAEDRAIRAGALLRLGRAAQSGPHRGEPGRLRRPRSNWRRAGRRSAR